MNFSFFRFAPRSENSSFTSKQLLFALALVYLFGAAIRLLLFYQAGQIGPLWAGDDPIAIWTPDAGRYGYYAKEILAGVSLPMRDDFLLGYLVAFVSSVTTLSVDWVMIFLPIVIAPLIAIPMGMIAASLGAPMLGVLSGLIAVSGSFFYLRSHIGYMDTDGVNLFLILMAIAFVVKGFTKRALLWFWLASLTLILFGWWYHSASAITLLIVATALIAVLVYGRRERVLIGGFALLLIPVAPIGIAAKLVAVTVGFALLVWVGRSEKIGVRYYWAWLAAGLAAALLVAHPEHYVARAIAYMTPDTYRVFTGIGGEYTYLNDLPFVGEAGKVDLWHAYSPLFVSTLFVWVATLGYLLMMLRFPFALLIAPLMVLGYLSGWAGGRFSMYATPVLAFGFVTLLYFLRELLERRFGAVRYVVRIPYYGTTLVLVLMVYNIFSYNSRAAMGLQFYAGEKVMFDSFAKKLSSKDTIVTWWDYGWPLWYYTGYNNTLTDNGYHGGPDSHIVAQILLDDNPYFVSNAARYLSRYRPPSNRESTEFALPKIAKEHNLSALIDLWHQKKQIELSDEEGSVYIVLHQNMLSYFGVLRQFASWDITQKGVYRNMPQYQSTPVVKPFSHNYSLLEGYSYILDSSDGKVMDNKGNKTAVNMLMIAENNTRKESYSYHNSSNITLLNAKGLLLWLDKKAYQGFYVQAMLLDVYDKNLFEKVAETSRAKIFRVKKPKKD